MTRGIVLTAFNVPEVDFVRLAVFSANRMKEMFGDISISIITNSPDWLRDNYTHCFDNIIYRVTNNITVETRNGQLYIKQVEYPDIDLLTYYDALPYDRTLLLNPNVIAGSSMWLTVENTSGNFAYGGDVMILEKSEETEQLVAGGDCNLKRFPFAIHDLDGSIVPFTIDREVVNCLVPRPKYKGQYLPLQYNDSTLIVRNIIALTKLVTTGNGLWN